jgi:hypothetical protein
MGASGVTLLGRYSVCACLPVARCAWVLHVQQLPQVKHKLRKREDWTLSRFSLFLHVDTKMTKYIKGIERDPHTVQIMIKRDCQNWSMHSKVTDIFFFFEISYYPFRKVPFAPKVGGLTALNSKLKIFSKMVDWAMSYVPWKCATVIVVN